SFPLPSSLFPYTTLFRSSLLCSAILLSSPTSNLRVSSVPSGARPSGNAGALGGSGAATSSVGSRLARRHSLASASRSTRGFRRRSEEHTPELQSPYDIVC